MSERLTDDTLSRLGAVARQARRHDGEVCDGCYRGNCAAVENALDAARNSLPLMLAELREHRAADLTDADLNALRELRGLIVGNNPSDVTPRMRVALAVLDRLLHGGK